MAGINMVLNKLNGIMSGLYLEGAYNTMQMVISETV